MNELSLFSGAGGGLLATHHLLGWRTIGYVEWNDYCQRVLAQRIADGFLDEAPIYGDIRAFIDQGYAERYRGMVDVVAAGFPCQPFSVAGKRKESADERNMWPATVECIRIIRPRFAFLENVPGLLSSGYFGTVLGDLAESGYDCRWRILSAAEVGAPHKRDRLWIVCYSEHPGSFEAKIDRGAKKGDGDCKTRKDKTGESAGSDRKYAELGDPHSEGERCFENGECGKRSKKRTSGICKDVSNPAGIRCNRNNGESGESEEPGDDGEKQPSVIRTSWWDSEPGLGRMAHGLADRVDRLKAIGNGQVSAVAASAWNLLMEGCSNENC